MNQNNNNNKKSQKLPNIPKKKNFLSEHDKQNIKKFYEELKNFYNENNDYLNNSLIKTKYICIKDDINNEYFIDNYDRQKFYDYGIVKNKKLIVCLNEIFYLNQIGLITFKNFELSETISNNINLLNLYCYLKRKGKIIKCLELYKDKLNYIPSLENYLLIYENTEDFNLNNFSYLIYNYISDSINYDIINNLIINFNLILKIFSNKNSSSPKENEEEEKFLLAITQGTSITFLSIKELTSLK
jgi:hypothetical protein